MKLWKFTTADSFKEILANCTVRVSPPDDLNDPGEFKYGIEEYKLDEIKLNLNKIVKLHKNSISKILGTPINSASDLNEEGIEKIYEFISKEILKFKLNSHQIRFNLNKIYSVFSCCEDFGDDLESSRGFPPPIKNPAIWSHYADNHKGVAFSIDETILGPEVSFKKVDYRHEAPKIKFDLDRIKVLWPALMWEDPDQFNEVFCMKHITWKYEFEYRAFYLLDKSQYDPDKNMYFVPIDMKGIDRIVFGCRTSEKDMREILWMIAKNKDLDYSIMKVFEFPNSYTLYPYPFAKMEK